eukprot:TRINITY_DN48270_c0_g1_i1.p1 TRINITY_DN48270_c0_g1~~TRINITY_DN48270_c0_g1_i1.p1  ORF type:complete len:192 (-),score=8.56 TRINITY_DN48270_c0_g1_i1:272-847(-)
MKAIFFVFALALLGVDACPLDDKGQNDPDCRNVDMGSCGTACCKMAVTFKSPDATGSLVRDAIIASVGRSGGPDGRYSLQTTADGQYGFTNWNTSSIGYIGQLYHQTEFPGQVPLSKTTTGPYRDVINVWIQPGSPVVARFFSMSLIAGALGDAGQNYKNIIQLTKNVFTGPSLEHSVERSDSSCPAPSSP